MDTPDKQTGTVPSGLGFWGGAMTTVVFLALISPVIVVLAMVIQGGLTSRDITKLLPAIQGGFWPLLVFFAIVTWRREIPQLISRLRRAGPKGLEFTESTIARGARSLQAKAASGRTRPLQRPVQPEPVPDAQDMMDSRGE